MTTLTRTLDTFLELDVDEKLTTIVAWIVGTWIFVMVGIDGYLWPTPVGILLGILIGLLVAWATLDVLAD
ncbi:hypothetical protein [Halalkaliarchaeum desulfuricum]|uniref:hypothetical protein n=1 Tax=Halalkaliarchaeum desulfuricum TaxID=2055893 RepID=UPI000E6BB939|nr:hypothetical protein [Halalkaliarchaeum desulfuricum]